HDGEIRQAVSTHVQVPAGWRVIRTSQAALVQRARESFAALRGSSALQRTRLDVRAFGAAGTPLKLLCTAGAHTVTVRSSAPLTPARAHALDQPRLRTQLGRLGDTPFVLGAIEDGGLASGLFLAMSELNHLRQHAVAELVRMVDLERDTGIAERHASIAQAIAGLGAAREVSGGRREVEPPLASRSVTLAADVHRVEDAHAAADAGATEISFDPFLRHPVPPRARVRALAAELRERGIAFRVRTPTIVRPEERAAFEPWLALDLPLLCGHVGLVAELAAEGRDVVADYAVNCFNQHTASEYRRMGATRIVLSIELTVREMADICAQQGGAGFDVLVYGRPEGMTLEHCVLSAAFDRTPTTCRDLCVQKHPRVDLTDPAGYTFAVATDAACRNRLLHSRPIEASEYLPSLWDAGVRGYRLLFNVPGDPVAAIVARYRAALDALVAHAPPPLQEIRALAGNRFTRGHFSRAV
ncbi:MAG TPA: DUF3656 domain-containing protein, partial [Gemmatimonadaceae bacterium]|nr:DUF3656 domain-containing protein [Gemmatimonadaceae bacterium]